MRIFRKRNFYRREVIATIKSFYTVSYNGYCVNRKKQYDRSFLHLPEGKFLLRSYILFNVYLISFMQNYSPLPEFKMILISKTTNYQDFNFIHFNLKLLLTTLTELIAIAAPAIIGFSKNPVKGYKIPAAIGMPITL